MHWLWRRIHPTWLFTMMCGGFVGGVALARVWTGETIVLAVAGVVLVALAFWRQRYAAMCLVLFGGGLLGLARGGYGQYQQAVYRELYHSHVRLTGVVSDDVDPTNHGLIHIHLRNVMIENHTLPGQVFASVKGSGSVRRSDKVMIDGELEEGFGSFPATLTGDIVRITREQGGDIPLDIRDGFAAHVRQGIKEPEASLGIGYLLGQKSALPASLVDALQLTALTHIVVASGYNLTILVRVGRRLFERVSKYLAALTSVGLIASFIAMTGMSPSMTRAGLVAGLSLAAWYTGRRFHPVTLLLFAAAITTLVNPSYVWGDLGWLLSFAAFGGVMIVAPILSGYFFGEKVPFVGQLLMETASAQLATLPIMVLAFGQLSIVGLVANLLVLPFIPLAMLLVACTGFVAFLFPSLATVAGWPAEQLLSLQANVITWCADIPWAMAKPRWSVWMAAAYFLAVGCVLVYMKRVAGVKLFRASIIE